MEENNQPESVPILTLTSIPLLNVITAASVRSTVTVSASIPVTEDTEMVTISSETSLSSLQKDETGWVMQPGKYAIKLGRISDSSPKSIRSQIVYQRYVTFNEERSEEERKEIYFNKENDKTFLQAAETWLQTEIKPFLQQQCDEEEEENFPQETYEKTDHHIMIVDLQQQFVKTSLSHRAVVDHFETLLLHNMTQWGNNELERVAMVIVLPDEQNEEELETWLDMVLKRLGFKRCLLLPESLCATFGAGLSHACVVNLGATETRVTCVEDGILQPQSMTKSPVGSKDVIALLKRLGKHGIHSEKNLLVNSLYFIPYKSHETGLLLDEAISLSVASLGDLERIRRMLHNILLVGEGSKMSSFSQMLYQRLWTRYIQQEQQLEADALEMVTTPRDEVLVWKGASMMAQLEGMTDLWITRSRYMMETVCKTRLIRENTFLFAKRAESMSRCA
jgi:actin-related protein